MLKAEMSPTWFAFGRVTRFSSTRNIHLAGLQASNYTLVAWIVDCGLLRRRASLSHKLVSYIVAELSACWFAVVFPVPFLISFNACHPQKSLRSSIIATITPPFFFADLASNHNNRLSNPRQRGVRFLFMYGAC